MKKTKHQETQFYSVPMTDTICGHYDIADHYIAQFRLNFMRPHG